MNVSTTSSGPIRLGGSILHDSSPLPIVLPRQNTVGAPTAWRDESLLDFARWLLQQQQLHVTDEGDRLQVVLPQEDREKLNGCEILTLAVSGDRLVSISDTSPDATPDVALADPLTWLIERGRRTSAVAAARPAGQPSAVPAIAERLFPAYQVENGQIHLAGCQLEDRPFLRLTYASGQPVRGTVRHYFVAADGCSVPDSLVASLRLDHTQPLIDKPPHLESQQLASLIAAGRRMASQQAQPRNPLATVGEPLAVTVLWAKYATGQIQFTIGSQSTALNFSDWASTLKPIRYRCALTGGESFRLAAVDDGRIVTAEEIATCEITGRRMLTEELVECHVTGRRVLPEFTSTCPVLNRPALKDHFASCVACRQRVSEAALANGVCLACRQLKPVASNDPRLVWLSSEHPQLHRWKWWRLAETCDCYIVRGSGLLRQMLLICDRHSLQIKHLAYGRRGSQKWLPADRSTWA